MLSAVLYVRIDDFCSLMRYFFELAWLVCMSSMDCSSYGSFDIKVTSSATVGVYVYLFSCIDGLFGDSLI
jgi:hypothetical protein